MQEDQAQQKKGRDEALATYAPRASASPPGEKSGCAKFLETVWTCGCMSVIAFVAFVAYTTRNNHPTQDATTASPSPEPGSPDPTKPMATAPSPKPEAPAQTPPPSIPSPISPSATPSERPAPSEGDGLAGVLPKFVLPEGYVVQFELSRDNEDGKFRMVIVGPAKPTPVETITVFAALQPRSSDLAATRNTIVQVLRTLRDKKVHNLENAPAPPLVASLRSQTSRKCRLAGESIACTSAKFNAGAAGPEGDVAETLNVFEPIENGIGWACEYTVGPKRSLDTTVSDAISTLFDEK
jgi:hypothetical protein